MSTTPNAIGIVDDGGANVGKVESDVQPDGTAARKEMQTRAADNARAVVEKEREADERSTAEVMRSFQELAARETKLTVEQLLAMDGGIDAPPQRPKADRETVAARGVPELHLKHVYDKAPIECEALTTVQEFLGSDMTLLVLSGGVGTRKSGSACWALAERAGRYVTADDLSGLAAARDEEGIVLYRQLKKAALLVIDDLGGEYVDDKGWFVRALASIVDARYAACLKTIMTTNLNAERFKATYGERIADRIRESGRFRDVAGLSVRAK